MSVESSRSVVGRYRPYGALAAAAACWGVVTPAEKYAVGGIGPFATLLVECMAAAIVVSLNPRIRVRGRQTPLWRYALLGLLEPGLTFGALNLGLRHTSAGSAALLDGLQPCFLLILGVVLLGEQATFRATVAVGIATAGVVVVTAWHATLAVGAGDVLVLLAPLAGSLASIVVSRLSAVADAVEITTYQLWFGYGWSVLFAALAWATGGQRWPDWQDWHALVVAAAAGIVGLLVASLLYNFGIARAPMRVAGMSLNLIPVFGVAAAVVGLSESITTGQVIGGVLILAGMLAFPYELEAPAG